MADLQSLGRLIRSAREARGMTGVELARRIERPHSFVVRLEKGQIANVPDPQTLRDIGAALGVPMEEMLRALGYLDRGETTSPATNGSGWRELEPLLNQVRWNEERLDIIKANLSVFLRQDSRRRSDS